MCGTAAAMKKAPAGQGVVFRNGFPSAAKRNIPSKKHKYRKN